MLKQQGQPHKQDCIPCNIPKSTQTAIHDPTGDWNIRHEQRAIHTYIQTPKAAPVLEGSLWLEPADLCHQQPTAGTPSGGPAPPTRPLALNRAANTATHYQDHLTYAEHLPAQIRPQRTRLIEDNTSHDRHGHLEMLRCSIPNAGSLLAHNASHAAVSTPPATGVHSNMSQSPPSHPCF